uniref:non-specific serine/threonine protein kinase n=1 Tax=Parastrongyloides trichosuri TaxID=131310 RepID=A0A0N4ZA92_PARTI
MKDLIKLPYIIHTSAEIYTIDQVLGSGGFANVYRATVHSNQSSVFAMKISKELQTEINFMVKYMSAEHLKQNFGNKKPPLPEIFAHGYCATLDASFLCMRMYASTFKKFQADACQITKTELKYIHDVVCSVISALQYISRFSIAHLDIKSQNIMLRNHMDTSNCVLIDFGAAQYCTGNPKVSKNSIKSEGLSVPFTPMYCPISVHENTVPQLKDDLESLLYNCYEWGTGTLPWTQYRGNLHDICNSKKNFMETFTGAFIFDNKVANYLRLIHSAVQFTSKNKAPNYKNLLYELEKHRLNCATNILDISCSTAEPPIIENTGFHTVGPTIFRDLCDDFEAMSVNKKLIVNTVRNQKHLDLLSDAPYVDVLLNFSLFDFRGFYYLYRTQKMVNGMNTNFDRVAFNRLSYNSSNVLSLIKGLESNIRLNHSTLNLKNKTILILEPAFAHLLIDIVKPHFKFIDTVHSKCLQKAVTGLVKILEQKMDSVTVTLVPPNMSCEYIRRAQRKHKYVMEELDKELVAKGFPSMYKTARN